MGVGGRCRTYRFTLLNSRSPTPSREWNYGWWMDGGVGCQILWISTTEFPLSGIQCKVKIRVWDGFQRWVLKVGNYRNLPGLWHLCSAFRVCRWMPERVWELHLLNSRSPAPSGEWNSGRERNGAVGCQILGITTTEFLLWHQVQSKNQGSGMGAGL